MGKQLVTKIREMNPLARRGALLLLGLLASLACLLRPRHSDAGVDRNSSWAKVGLVTLCTLLLCMFMGGGVFNPGQVQAAIAAVSGNSWSNIYSNQAGVNPGTVAYTVNSGSNAKRLLVVAVSTATSAAGSQTLSMTYGTRSMQAVRADGGTTQAHSFLFYLNEADLDLASNSNLVFTFGGAAASLTNVYAAVFDGVDQTTPITANSGNTATTNVALTTALVVAANEQAVEVVSMGRLASATPRTITAPAAGWGTDIGPTLLANGTTLSLNSYILSDTTAGSTTAAHTISNATAALYSMSAMRINPYVTTNPATTAGTVTAVNGGLTTINVIAPYTDDSNVDNTLLVEYKLSSDSTYTILTGSALPHADTPYSVAITGLITGLSYDVRVTYQDPVDGVSGTAVQTISGVTTAAIPVQTTFYMTRNTTTDVIADGVCNITGLTPYTATGIGKTTADFIEFGTGSRFYPTTVAGSSVTVLNVYSPAYTGNAVDISNISASIPFQGNATTGNTIKLDLYEYDPNGAANNGTLVASSVAKAVTATLTRYTWVPADFTINGSGRVGETHRLQFRLTQYSATSSSTSRLYFGIAGNLTSTSFTVTQTPIAGNNPTTAETATAVSAGTTSIKVTAAYTNDGNANNTLRVEYKLTAAPDTSYVKWTGSDLSHSGTPYSTIITGLTKGSSYAVRVTYLDADGVSGTAVQTISGVIPAVIPVQMTYYMTRDTATNLAADGTCNITGVTPYTVTGIGKTTTLGSEFGTASRYYPTTVAGSSVTVLNVYTPEYAAKAVDISGISASIAFRGNAANDTIKLDLYDYDPAGAANNGTLVASSTAKTVTGGTTLTRYAWVPGDFTLNGSGTVALNHRLQFRLTQYTTATASSSRLYFGVAGNTASTNFTVTETPAAGANPTTAGTPSASAAGATRIDVTAPFTDDGNSNNTLRVEYKISGTPDASYVRWTGNDLTHSDSPYVTQITGLNAKTSYDVRVTYLDIDGVSGTAVQVISGIITPEPGVEAYQNWARVINDSNSHATGIAVNLTGNFAVTAPAGANRVLVVAISQANRAANTAPATPTTISYGGVTLRLATSNRQTSSRAHTWLYYLKDNAVMDGTSHQVVVNWSAGVAATKIDVACAVYVGVDQIPATYTTGNQIVAATGTTAMALNAAMPVIAKAKAIYALNVANVVNATIPTYTTASDWTTPLSASPTTYAGAVGTTFSYSIQLAQRSIPTVDTTDAATTGTRNVTSYYAMSALVLPPVAVSAISGATAPDLNVYANDKNKVVDAFTLIGSGVVTNIQITGNANTTSSNISALRIYRKVGANLTVLEGNDVQLGTDAAFGAVGTTPVNIAVSETISGNTNYIIVYDIAAGAKANGISIAFSGAVTAIAPPVGSLTDTGSVLTLNATTAVGTGVVPADARLWKSSAATKIDAFTLQHNGTTPTDDDPVTTVTVTLTPEFISGGSGGTISKFKLMEITDAGGAVLGSVNSATTADVWNVPTPTLAATATETTYFVRVTTADTITPSLTDTSGTATGYYPGPPATSITGLVTAISHTKGTSKVVLADTASAASFVIDVEKPIGPSSLTALTGSTGGQINLSWAAATDSNGGAIDPATPYIIRRSAPEGTTPNPYCVDGTSLVLTPTDQSNRSFVDTGLIDSFATRYYYRVCAKDAQGNISSGVTAYANAKVTSVCNNTPTFSLTSEDLLSTSQVIKSANTAPFKLLISNNDTGTCPDVDFTVTLANEVNSIHFDKAMGADPATAVQFPAVVTLGTGGLGAPTGKTLNVYITGKAEANQLELYKFALQVSNPGNVHGAPLTTIQVTGILNDMPPIVHNSSNMGKFQYGNWGQTYTCATCHSNSTTNIKGIYQIISTPIGRRNVVFTTTSAVSGLGEAVYGDDTRPLKTVSNNVCSVCHHNTRQHQYSASKADLNNGVLGVVGPGADEAYNTDHHNSRDCVKCHTHNSAFRSLYGLCGDCHGFKATGYSPVSKNTMVKDLTNALGPNPPNYGAHLRHFKAALACAACHSNTNHGSKSSAWAGDNSLEIGFSINKDTFVGFNPNAPVNGGKFFGTNNLNVPFAWTPNAFTNITTVTDYNNSCVTYCHGGWKGNAGAITSPIWVGTGQAACGSCHNASGAVPPTSGSHEKHAATSGPGLGIACARCHGTYSNYSTSNAHINGNVEWKLTDYPASTYNGANAGATGALAPSAAFSTCNNLYCHSDVQGKTGNGTGGPNTFATAKWGDPSTALCGSCHKAVLPKNDTGSHSNHENAEVSFDCHICHDNGGTTGPLNHANGLVNFQFIGLATGTVYSRGNNVPAGTAFGTCSASMCHGDYSRSWGTLASGLPLCEKCHGSATSPKGFYRTTGPDGTLSVYSSAVGVHDIHIQNLNSPRKTTFARFTSYAGPIGCNQCHSVPTGPFTAGHIDTKLPAEVQLTGAGTIAGRGLLYGNYTAPNFSHASETCSAVWCHGGGMKSNRAALEYYSTVRPVRTNPKWNVPYLTGNGDADCTKCHALPPPAAKTTSTHYGKTLASCTSCHGHVSTDGHGFKDKALHVNGIIEGGCDGCHGNPPITNVVGAADGLAKPALNALNGGAGAHNAHQLLPLIGNNCSTCHNSYAQAMPSNELEMGFGSLAGNPLSGVLSVYSSVDGSIHWKSTNAATTTVLKTPDPGVICSNIYCHGGGTSALPALGGGSSTTPNWEGAVACGDCHGIDSANTPVGGSHQRHAQLIASLACQTCHGSTNDNGTHVNASVSWHLQRTDPLIGPLATYNNLSAGSLPGFAPRSNGTDYKSCNNLYCHSNVQSANGAGAPTVYGSPTWGTDNGKMTCSSCHKYAATDSSADTSHVKHANTTSGMGISCGYCHQDAGFGYALHTDGSVFVNFTSYIGGAYSAGTFLSGGMNKKAGSAAYGSCSATFCHGDLPSPVWGTVGPLACNTCHSAKVDDVSWSGRHKTHYNYSTMPSNYTQTVQDVSSVNKYRFNCAHCHDDNIAKHSLKPSSANSAARVFFGISAATPASSSKRGTYIYGAPAGATDNGFNFTDGSCNGSYCHSNGRGGTPNVPTLTWNTAPTTGSNCLFCHDGKSATATASGLSPRHDKHMNSLNNGIMGTDNGFNCVDCHAPSITNTNNTTIADKRNHVNKILNYSGARAIKSYSAGQCSYCHSNGNRNAAGVPIYVNMTGSKAWTSATGAITTCNTCHGRSNAYGYPDYANGGANTTTSNLHLGHMSGQVSTTACADCHRKTGDATTANKFRAYSTLHLNGTPDVNFNTVQSYVGTKATVATAGNRVTCSNIVCHGQGAPVWGATSTVATCQKCHGSKVTPFATITSAQVAPGYNNEGTDTSMTKNAPTDARVGAHQRHLTSNAIASVVKCSNCHVNVTGIRTANHWNYSTATLTFTGVRATGADLSHSGTNVRTNGIMACNNLWCHTGKYNTGTAAAMSPFWNMTGIVKEAGTTVADCTKCHAMPPSSALVGSHTGKTLNATDSIATINGVCGSCHTNLSPTASNVGNAFKDKALHVNGTIEVVQNCNSCHDYDTTGGGTAWGISNYGATVGLEGRGAHAKHIEYLKTRFNVTLLPTDTWTSPGFLRVCGACHSITEGTAHSMSTPTNPRSITFGDSATNPRNFGSAPVYNGNSATSSSVNPKSCSNTDCHYRTSPIWSTY